MPVSHPIFKCFTEFLTLIFIWTSCIIPQNAQAQTVSAPGVARPLGQTFTPALIKGLRIDAQNAFQFEFLIDAGDAVGAGSKPALTQGRVTNPPLHDESLKLIKYFLASLTLPEKDLWVNLSPYEHDRVIPEAFGQTEMGRDLLEQDYILKQLTASLMSPENEEGKKFWEKVYEKIYQEHNSPQPPLYIKRGSAQRGGVTDPSADDTFQQAIEVFNKVWIVPETGYFYEHNNTVFIADAKLKVMLEEDYLAQQQSELSLRGEAEAIPDKINFDEIASQKALAMTEETKNIIRQTILPLIEDEINNGASFANLRQIYNAQLLAVWFKKRLKDHILGQVYADKKNIESLSLRGEAEAIADIESIWQKYVAAFQSGASNIIQDEYDPVTQSIIPRKYFTGGATPVKEVDFASLNQAEAIAAGFTELASVTVSIGDPAMMNRKIILVTLGLLWVLTNFDGKRPDTRGKGTEDMIVLSDTLNLDSLYEVYKQNLIFKDIFDEEQQKAIIKYVEDSAVFDITGYLADQFDRGVKVMAFGETHGRKRHIDQAIDLIHRLKGKLTHLAVEDKIMQQRYIDEFMRTGDTNILDSVIAHGIPEHFLSKEEKDQYKALFIAAREAGIKIVAIDPRTEYVVERLPEGHPERDKMVNVGGKKMFVNEVMAANVWDIIRQDPNARVLFYAGSQHAIAGTDTGPSGLVDSSAALVLKQQLKPGELFIVQMEGYSNYPDLWDGFAPVIGEAAVLGRYYGQTFGVPVTKDAPFKDEDMSFGGDTKFVFSDLNFFIRYPLGGVNRAMMTNRHRDADFLKGRKKDHQRLKFKFSPLLSIFLPLLQWRMKSKSIVKELRKPPQLDQAMMASQADLQKDIDEILKVLRNTDILWEHLIQNKDQIRDIVLFGSDATETFREALDLFQAGVGERIVILGGYGRLTIPLIDRAVAEGFTVSINEETQVDKTSWPDIKKSINDENRANILKVSESNIIRQVMFQMAQTSVDVSRPLTREDIVLEESSTNSRTNVENYRNILKNEPSKNFRKKVILIQAPQIQLRAAATFQSVFEAEIEKKNIEPISYTSAYSVQGKMRDEIIKDAVGEAWRLIVYSLKEDLAIPGGLKSIRREFWDSAVRLLESLNPETQSAYIEEWRGLDATNVTLDQGKVARFPDGPRALVAFIRNSAMLHVIRPAVMGVMVQAARRVGGVDLRVDQADIQIFESENGFKFPKIDPAMLKGMDLNFAPVILRIEPVSVSQARMLLGLNTDAGDTEDSEDSEEIFQPMDRAREIEVSAL